MQTTLMRSHWESILNGLVYDLYMPEGFHRAGSRQFDLVKAARMSDLDGLSEFDNFRRQCQESEELRAALAQSVTSNGDYKTIFKFFS